MRVSFVVMLALLLLLLTSCSSVTVRHDFDPEYDFAKFKTYRWATAEELNPDDLLAKNPLVYRRVQAAVDKAFTAKGITKIESGDLDFVVVTHAGVKEKLQVHQTGHTYRGWYDPFWGPYGGRTHVSTYKEGTLVIDVVSLANNELAWRGMGTDLLDNYRDSEKMQTKLDEVAAKILASFPPQ